MLKQIAIARQSTKSFKSILKVDGVQVTDLTDWTCFIQLRNKKTKTISGTVDREVTTKNTALDAFVITLTSFETDIEEGAYVLGLEYRNATTLQRLEDPENIVNIKIVGAWVYD
jgi:cell division protein YceG involved in septum cleavage